MNFWAHTKQKLPKTNKHIYIYMQRWKVVLRAALRDTKEMKGIHSFAHMYISICTHTHTPHSHYLSLYIYIYIYEEREKRERDLHHVSLHHFQNLTQRPNASNISLSLFAIHIYYTMYETITILFWYYFDTTTIYLTIY